jgi:hypothetical protein
VLTHCRLGKLETATLGLTFDTTGQLSGGTAAGLGAPHATRYGLMQEVVDKINNLFTGSGIDEVDAVSVTETMLRHIVKNEVQMGDLAPLANILISMGLDERSRGAASRDLDGRRCGKGGLSLHTPRFATHRNWLRSPTDPEARRDC